MEEEKERLFIGGYIPESRAFDYFSGFGNKELAITGVAFFIAAIIAVIIYINTGQILYSAIICVGIVLLTVIAIVRNNHDESMIDQIMVIFRYYESPKQFEPELNDMYEN